MRVHHINEWQDADIYDDGFLRVEHNNYYVTCGGQKVVLPLKEFLILSRLARNAERIIPSEELWRQVWGRAEQFNSGSLRVHIYNLRGKLAPYGLRIESMINVGYRLIVKGS